MHLAQLYKIIANQKCMIYCCKILKSTDRVDQLNGNFDRLLFSSGFGNVGYTALFIKLYFGLVSPIVQRKNETKGFNNRLDEFFNLFYFLS